ncbi:hypothetical protein D3C87_1794330 [compost metagenome]
MHAHAPAFIEIDPAAEILPARRGPGQCPVMDGSTQAGLKIDRRIENRQLPGQIGMHQAVPPRQADGRADLGPGRADPAEHVDIG